MRKTQVAEEQSDDQDAGFGLFMLWYLIFILFGCILAYSLTLMV